MSAVVRAAAELRARGQVVALQALVEMTGAGTACGTCRPYVCRAAITGESAMPVMGWREGQAWIDRLGGAEVATPRYG